MTFDQARFGKFVSGLGLSSSLSSGRLVTLYQGEPDILQSGKDILTIKDGTITHAAFLESDDRISFAEIEMIMAVSERIKAAKFPPLALHFSLDKKITGIEAKPPGKIPVQPAATESLSGLSASPGKVSGICTHLLSQGTGKILVLKNSKDLADLKKMKPAGIVLEEGSLLSHAAILAREAHVPAIMMVKNATVKLKEGDEILLDATHGKINIRTSR